jgi:hypothetical protein
VDLNSGAAVEVMFSLLAVESDLSPATQIFLVAIFAMIGLASVGFGSWLILSSLHHRWGETAAVLAAVPVFVALMFTWPLFTVVVLPLWAARRAWVRIRRQALASPYVD